MTRREGGAVVFGIAASRETSPRTVERPYGVRGAARNISLKPANRRPWPISVAVDAVDDGGDQAVEVRISSLRLGHCHAPVIGVNTARRRRGGVGSADQRCRPADARRARQSGTGRRAGDGAQALPFRRSASQRGPIHREEGRAWPRPISSPPRAPPAAAGGRLSDWHPVDLAALTCSTARRRAHGHRSGGGRGRDHGLRHPGGRAGDQHRPQRRAGLQAAGKRAGHQRRPPVRLLAAGAAVRRPGGDERHHGRGDRRGRREHDPRADGPVGRAAGQGGLRPSEEPAGWRSAIRTSSSASSWAPR